MTMLSYAFPLRKPYASVGAAEPLSGVAPTGGVVAVMTLLAYAVRRTLQTDMPGVVGKVVTATGGWRGGVALVLRGAGGGIVAG